MFNNSCKFEKSFSIIEGYFYFHEIPKILKRMFNLICFNIYCRSINFGIKGKKKQILSYHISSCRLLINIIENRSNTYLKLIKLDKSVLPLFVELIFCNNLKQSVGQEISQIKFSCRVQLTSFHKSSSLFILTSRHSSL